MFYIASLKHTNAQHEHITWWGKNHRGYTPVVGDYIGEYSHEDAAKLNDGFDYIAVPIESVRTLLSPEPYFRLANPARFYDQRGPVVDNSKTNWARLVAMSMHEGRLRVPKPVAFRGQRRAFAAQAEVTC